MHMVAANHLVSPLLSQTKQRVTDRFFALIFDSLIFYSFKLNACMIGRFGSKHEVTFHASNKA